MATYSQPIIGDWYIDANGHFIRAWGCLYQGGRLHGVILQPLSGKRHCITLTQWRNLDLMHYATESEPCNKTLLS